MGEPSDAEQDDRIGLRKRSLDSFVRNLYPVGNHSHTGFETIVCQMLPDCFGRTMDVAAIVVGSRPPEIHKDIVEEIVLPVDKGISQDVLAVEVEGPDYGLSCLVGDSGCPRFEREAFLKMDHVGPLYSLADHVFVDLRESVAVGGDQ